MLQLPDTDLKQTRSYHEVFAEGEQEGMEKGIERGIAQGIEKAIERGIEKGRRDTAANLVRLTSLDDAAIAAVTGLDPAAVAALRHPAG